MKAEMPPRRALQFLHWFCAEDFVEEIEGDITELYNQRVVRMRAWKARGHFWLDVWRHFRPWAFKKRKTTTQNIRFDMLKNYMGVAWRHIQKKKLYAGINAFGLSIALAFSVLVALFISDELNFDKVHSKANRLFLLYETRYDYRQAEEEASLLGSRNSKFATQNAFLPAILGPTLKEEFPEVKKFTRITDAGGLAEVDGVVLVQEQVFGVDADFFSMFDVEVIEGNPAEWLKHPSDLILTQSTVEKYFPGGGAMGKTMRLQLGNESHEFIVKGIVADAPSNQSLEYEMIMTVERYPWFGQNKDSWTNFSFPNFVLLDEQADSYAFREKLTAFCEERFAKNIEWMRGEQQVGEEVAVMELDAMPLSDIHLNKGLWFYRVSEPKNIYILGALCVFILLIANINYISLALTSASGRRFEVGVRKVMGAERQQLVVQFGVEALMMAFISMVLALGLATYFLPYFNEFTEKSLVLDGPTLAQMFAWALAFSVLVGLMAGIYPALVLSGFAPLRMLRQKAPRLNLVWLKPLVVLQFAISGLLIVSSLVMYRQMQLVLQADLGFNDDQVLVVPLHSGWSEEGNRLVEQCKVALSGDARIAYVSGTSISFSKGWSQYGYKVNEVEKHAFVYRVDPDYLNLLDIQLLQGRSFDASRPSEVRSIIVNEALVKDMGWEDPLSERLDWQNDSVGYEVIGVTKDYHFQSLTKETKPMFLTISNEAGYMTTLLVKIKGNEIPQALEAVETAWKKLAPDKPFNYSFLDDDVASQYASYERWSRMMGIATVFAIVIACLGIFGLSGINALNRTKEIGIRKVLGANSWRLIYLLNKEYVLLATLAFVLAMPLSWWLMRDWLADFTYSISLGWELFVGALLVAVLVSTISVSYHAIRAVRSNPVEALKNE
ncbi:ABC transporter permease [Cytophagales bacterium LB-30]|uniref:ABC transporter permease n=1 Tax=Shiella aurantiaca TaxID=3058365 RepID=A0ABT8F3W0_9BACT|nr:FtsX-like permease family protein [Shiella aurantiaca]MDN4165147.1 ABC transporter permease [Shiella aurantiaca]